MSFFFVVPSVFPDPFSPPQPPRTKERQTKSRGRKTGESVFLSIVAILSEGRFALLRPISKNAGHRFFPAFIVPRRALSIHGGTENRGLGTGRSGKDLDRSGSEERFRVHCGVNRADSPERSLGARGGARQGHCRRRVTSTGFDASGSIGAYQLFARKKISQEAHGIRNIHSPVVV